MNKRFGFIILLIILMMTLSPLIYAEAKFKDWADVSNKMEEVLREALSIYEKGGDDAVRKAYDQIDIAYFKYYEKLGFEKIVMGTISGERGTTVENQFYLAKKSIRAKEDVSVVKDEIETLINYLHEDANTLDGMRGKDGGSQSGVFASVLLLTLREGLEAILIIAAIIAYLVKTNNKKYLKGVYIGAILGIVASVLLAVVFNVAAEKIGDAASGAGQEIFEGVGMFLAVIVLFYVSNWMLAKSEVEVWNRYIQSKVDNSISKGNSLTLAFSAFLAVAREGAELIIFFQGMRNNISNNPHQLWGGLAVAIVVLAIIYFLITKMSVKLPLKPFFTFTSILMFVLCISFIGKGVYELQEANVIGRTTLEFMNGFTFDLLGIYDRLETLVPQIILVVITVITVIIQFKNNRKIRAKLQKEHAQNKTLSEEE